MESLLGKCIPAKSLQTKTLINRLAARIPVMLVTICLYGLLNMAWYQGEVYGSMTCAASRQMYSNVANGWLFALFLSFFGFLPFADCFSLSAVFRQFQQSTG